MSEATIMDLIKIAKILHNRHGVGDIKSVSISGAGKVEIEAEGYQMRPHVRRGRAVGDTVFLYGRQLCLKNAKAALGGSWNA